MEQLATTKSADPMGLKIRRSESDEETASRGMPEIVQARYLIPCDGEHGWTQRRLAFMKGNKQTDCVGSHGRETHDQSLYTH